jgi:hypothetical protein
MIEDGGRVARRAWPALSLLLAQLLAAGFAVGQTPSWPVLRPAAESTALAGTALLEERGDVPADLLAGVDRFLR